MVHPERDLVFLITRPLPEAQEMARALIHQGYKVIIDPLLDIQPVDCPSLSLKDVQAVITTSINGIRRLSQLTSHRLFPLYVVGDMSHHEAVQRGFQEVYAAQGSVDSLLELLRIKLLPAEGKLLYVSGQEVRKDFVSLMAKENYQIERLIVYKALAAHSLKPETHEALITGRLNALLFFSPRTTETFIHLTKLYRRSYQDLVAICMSEDIALPLKKFEWHKIIISSNKSGRSMIEALESYFFNSKR